LHGYALQFTITFTCETLDENNWVVDFGGLKLLERYIKEAFDHKTVVAVTDPAMPKLKELYKMGVLDLLTLPAVGCEAFAQRVADMAQRVIYTSGRETLARKVKVISVECREHGANSATYYPQH